MPRALHSRSRAATAVAIQPVRCAVYCRVSTDAQADKEFNSVEAQQEACETYVGLHRSEGWTIAAEPYLDPGYTGSNTKRPGLTRLIADIEAREIDVVVVYKFDRLSRSMLDFLQLLDFFKKHGVSFVSVSQRFDTSTPVGEVTLNILLSFAQFERQIIAERTRDKMQACRRRGRWTGGRPPLGYDVAPEGGKLVVNKDEAEQVRTIFRLYADNPSLIGVSQELNRRGWRQRTWTNKKNKVVHGGKWNKASLRTLLANPLYIGRQRLGNDTFKGEHRSIVLKALFDKVQRLLERNRSNGGASGRNSHGFLLRGLVRCAACDSSMVPSPAKRRGKVYRYYRCSSSEKNGATSCPTRSVQADQIEQFVIDQVRRIGTDAELRDETFRQAIAQLKAKRRDLKAEKKWLARDLAGVRVEVERLVDTVSRINGPAADAVANELTKAQERVATLENRRREIEAELSDVNLQTIDRDDLDRALAKFDPIWEVLLTPERERVLKLLIERISYDGATQKLAINWRLGGFCELAAEVGP